MDCGPGDRKRRRLELDGARLSEYDGPGPGGYQTRAGDFGTPHLSGFSARSSSPRFAARSRSRKQRRRRALGSESVDRHGV